MTDHYQRIGQAALSVSGERVSKLLIYSEVEDGVVSADIFYQLPGRSTADFRFAPPAMRELIYEYWEAGDQEVAPRSWAALKFVVEGGRFSASLVYPGQLDPDEDLAERRPRAVAEYFPGVAIDYSAPHG